MKLCENRLEKKKNLAILEECDRLRDEVLPNLGVRLEDKTNQTCVKLVDRETLLLEQKQKQEMIEAKKAEKLSKEIKKQQKRSQQKQQKPKQ